MSVNGDCFQERSEETTSVLNSSGHTVEIQLLPQSSPTTGTSWFVSALIVVNAALGAGLLAFPEAYHRTGGILISLCVQTVMLLFAFVALVVLAYCSDACHASSYQDVVQGMCGRWGQRICSLCIALYCFGTCITFLIVIGDQWDSFLYFVTNDKLFYEKWYMNRKFIIASTATVVILPLCFPKRIDFLKIASTVGVVSIIYVALLVVVKYFKGPIHSGPIKTKPDHWTDVFIVIPTICFGYQCHVSVIPIYACLKVRTLPNFVKTVSVAMIICALCYSFVASFGYLTFGANVKSDILLSYKTTPDVIVGVVLLAVKIYTTYPILHFCGRSAIESIIIDVLRVSPNAAAQMETLRRVLLTLVWFIASVVIAVTIPNIADVIELLGGLAVLFILVLPGVCLMQLTLSKRELWSVSRYWLFLLTSCSFTVIGFFIFGLTTTNGIMDDINGANDN